MKLIFLFSILISCLPILNARSAPVQAQPQQWLTGMSGGIAVEVNVADSDTEPPRYTIINVVMPASMAVEDRPEYSSLAEDFSLDLLNEPGVLQEIEMVNHQVAQFNDVRRTFSQQATEALKAYSDAGADLTQQQAAFDELVKIKTIRKAAISKTLLPHQFERLRQLTFQRKVRNLGGTEAALQNDLVANELGISDEQKKQIAEVQKKLWAEVRKQNQKLRDEAEKEILNLLSEGQRGKLKQLRGEKFVERAPESRKQGSGY